MTISRYVVRDLALLRTDVAVAGTTHRRRLNAHHLLGGGLNHLLDQVVARLLVEVLAQPSTGPAAGRLAKRFGQRLLDDP
jgi:hypothetical protein